MNDKILKLEECKLISREIIRKINSFIKEKSSQEKLIK